MTPEPGHPPPERLSIAHLLVWTATSAVLLGFQRALKSGDNVVASWLSDVLIFFYAPLYGAGLAACLLAAWRVVYGGPQFPRQPGHWLLVVSGISSLVSLSFQALITLAMWQASILTTLLVINAAGALATALCYALAARDARGYWRKAMFVAFTASLLVCLLEFGMYLTPQARYMFYLLRVAIFWLPTVIIAACALADLIRGERRDVLHWAGIIVRIAYSLVILAIPLLMNWLRPMAP